MNTQSKHTPGPWKAERGTGEHEGWLVITSQGMPADAPLAMVAKVSDIDDDAMHDARLIAAAPKLLAALVALTTNPQLSLGDLVYTVREREGEGWEGPAVVAWGNAVTLAREAIAEAEGNAHG